MSKLIETLMGYAALLRERKKGYDLFWFQSHAKHLINHEIIFAKQELIDKVNIVKNPYSFSENEGEATALKQALWEGWNQAKEDIIQALSQEETK